MSFDIPGFDELLNSLLTDYKNQFPEADSSQGSLIFIKSACYASALWGLYKYQEYISRQIFPDTADTENLEHHAWVRGLSRKVGETDPDFLSRLLDYIRRPPAGGNQYDYVKWAVSITNVKQAYCVPLAQGLGSVDVVIIADEVATGSEVPDQDLIDEVKAYIDDIRPVTFSAFRVLPPTIITQGVTMAITGASADKTRIATDITDYINALAVGDDLYTARLIQIAVNGGAETVNVTVPAATVVAGAADLIRAGVISVA
jgi:uncharacterized phage protein gp47/JayE